MVLGILSPVRAAVLKVEKVLFCCCFTVEKSVEMASPCPFVSVSESNRPSNGTLSPGKTSIISPISTVSGAINTVFPDVEKYAVCASIVVFSESENSVTDVCNTSCFSGFSTLTLSGRNAIKLLMLSRALSTALSCSISPMQYSHITATASGYSPIQKAPIQATLISINSLK